MKHPCSCCGGCYVDRRVLDGTCVTLQSIGFQTHQIAILNDVHSPMRVCAVSVWCMCGVCVYVSVFARARNSIAK